MSFDILLNTVNFVLPVLWYLLYSVWLPSVDVIEVVHG
jgi:uncharacterized membrane protein YccF (DUF307 family)